MSRRRKFYISTRLEEVYRFQLTSSTHDECLSRLPVQGEDVVAGDSILKSTGNVGISWSSTAGNHDKLRVENLFGSVLHLGDDVVSIFEVSEAVYVFDFLVAEINSSHPIHGLDVILNGLDELRPVDLDGVGVRDFPAVCLSVLKREKVSL
jgi:hypothetical protein